VRASPVVAALFLAACGSAAATTPPPAAAGPGPSGNSSNASHVADPAHIEGPLWSYTTSSTCDTRTSHGELHWVWDHATSTYIESGWAEWDTGDPVHVDWTCILRWESTSEELVGECPEKTGEPTLVRWRELPPTAGLHAWQLDWVTDGDCVMSAIARR
jgi:hypothetical protein